MLKTVMLRSALIAFACALSVTAHAYAADPKRVDVPAGDLTAALEVLAKQSGVELVYQTDQLKGLRTQGVTGNFSLEEAVTKLLEGTKLTLKTDTSGAMLIALPRASSNPETPEPGSHSSRTPPVPLADEGLNGLRLAQDQSAQQSDSNTSGQSPEEKKNPPSPQKDSEESLSEVVVTGTHIRGLQNTTSPVVVLSRKYIESTGLSTTSALIDSLPQNFALVNPAGVLVPGVSSPRLQGSSINLRGIGEGTTLTLVNGHRMASGFLGSAVDISALPLSLIDRVEVLTDGASAIYGSDAIGGVVNFILRRDLDGAETHLRGGWADGVQEYRAGQAVGSSWDSGNVMLSAEYSQRDLLRASERDFVPITSDVGSLYPEDEGYAVMLAGRQDLTSSVNVFADALYTRRDSYNEAGRRSQNERTFTENPQITAALGLDWAFTQSWAAEVSVGYARNQVDQVQIRDDASGVFIADSTFDVETAAIKIAGSLFELPGGNVRAALGVDWRSEALSVSSGRTTLSNKNFDQIVRSAFGEVHVPIVGAGNAMAAIRRFELSLAGRYDEYPSFGSSFDPQLGLMWEPVTGFRVRTTFGTSYKAPKLTDYDLLFNGTIALYFEDPVAPTGVSHQLWLSGRDAGGYSAQESESFSFGVDLAPDAISGLEVGLNYYQIKYENRIADPPGQDIMLLNPDSFAQLIIRDPTAAQVNEYLAIGDLGTGLVSLDPDFNSPDPNFTPDSIEVIVDGRRRNLSEVDTSGIDASIEYDFRAGDSAFEVGLAGTYILELEQRATSASAPFDTVDTFYNPPQLRVRGSIGWQYRPWAANIFVNHTGAYTDNRTVTPVEVSSYTTVDARLAFNFSEQARSGFWSGVTLTFGAQNVLDQDPPDTAIVRALMDMGFDPTNSNPMGRLVSMQLTKIW